MLECRDLWVAYPGFGTVLRGVTVRVELGKVTALLGPNGSGKTTLLLALAGLLEPERGVVLFKGEELRKQLPEARRHLGLLFQDPDDQLFNPTVRDELLFALNQLGLAEREKSERVERVAKLLHIAHLLERPVFALSMGEKKRVALASVLVYEPEVLLLDEPTANLDPQSSELFLSLLCKAKAEGKGVLVATQDVKLAEEVADEAVVLSSGSVVWSGCSPPPQEVLERAGLRFSPVSCKER
ncbi:MAG: ABC transporter ATP-binding protein [Thermofilum sp.]